MQQPLTNDYINWLRLQDGQLKMEESQLMAEEQWLQQKIIEHNNNQGDRLGQAILSIMANSYRTTPWQRNSYWLRDKSRELQARRVALQGRRAWLQQEKAKYGLQ